MGPIKICIVEDEIDAQNVLLSLINRSEVEFELLGTATSFEEGQDLLSKMNPNLVFLDINLNGKSGLELAKYIDTTKTTIVFTTAYDKYVLDALRLEAFDYLLKPIFQEDFNEMMVRYQKKRVLDKLTSAKDEFVVLNNNEGQHIILLVTIECIEASGAYCIFHLQKGTKVMVSKPLKFYADLLEEFNVFVRTHKSFLVNQNAISKVLYGENCVELKSGRKVQLSRNQKNNLKNHLGNQ